MNACFSLKAGVDQALSIAVDSSANVYVSGYSNATWGSPANPHAGGQDAFAAKLSRSGIRLRNTFMGSSVNDVGYGIAVDNVCNVYMGGYSNATWGNLLSLYAGSPDAFVAKIVPVVKPRKFFFNPVHNLKE